MIENLMACAPERAQASFYRTAAGAEIDLLLELGGNQGLWAIEIKRGLAPAIGKGLHQAVSDLKPAKTFIAYSGNDRYEIAKGVEVIGASALGELLAAL